MQESLCNQTVPAFIAFGEYNYVAVIDLHTLTLSGKIDAGGDPDGMAWATRP